MYSRLMSSFIIIKIDELFYCLMGQAWKSSPHVLRIDQQKHSLLKNDSSAAQRRARQKHSPSNFRKASSKFQQTVEGENVNSREISIIASFLANLSDTSLSLLAPKSWRKKLVSSASRFFGHLFIKMELKKMGVFFEGSFSLSFDDVDKWLKMAQKNRCRRPQKCHGEAKKIIFNSCLH